MEINVDILGTSARQILTQDQSATVSGVTSRGSFVSTQLDPILFLSREAHRGPLTLNLKSNEGIFERIKLGDSICIQDRCMIFSKSDILISIDKADTWEPANPSSTALSPIERERRISKICQQVPDKSGVFSSVKMDRLRSAILSGNGTNIIDVLEPFLGLGPGLTPSGDDLVLGILLTLNRWGRVLYPSLSMERINRPIIQASRQRTTALSASLIECAANAQADERLILALDSLVTGSPDLETCIACLKNYGSSSGEDTFLGMKLVMSVSM
jgi:hypothetical protein